jgi:hypothetical protein
MSAKKISKIGRHFLFTGEDVIFNPSTEMGHSSVLREPCVAEGRPIRRWIGLGDSYSGVAIFSAWAPPFCCFLKKHVAQHLHGWGSNGPFETKVGEEIKLPPGLGKGVGELVVQLLSAILLYNFFFPTYVFNPSVGAAEDEIPKSPNVVTCGPGRSTNYRGERAFAVGGHFAVELTLHVRFCYFLFHGLTVGSRTLMTPYIYLKSTVPDILAFKFSRSWRPFCCKVENRVFSKNPPKSLQINGDLLCTATHMVG